MMTIWAATGAAFFIILMSSPFCLAQSSPLPVIVTDRPTITPAPFVVPVNYIQAENGLALRKEHQGRSFNTPQTLVRLGVLPRLELRLTVPNYYLINSGETHISGVSDISVGTKIQAGPLPGKIDLAIIPGFTIPAGSKSVTTGAVDPFIQFTASRSISKNWTVGSAQSIFLQTEEAETQAQGVTSTKKNVIYQPTLVVFRKLGPHADLFSEYAGNFTKGKLSDQIFDAGAVWRFRRNQQLGIRAGVGLTKASPTTFVEFGYSLLLGKILR
ncbi:hypothetical protein BH11CYA1_BH11CYA1_22340 [soil metagenome]